MASLQISSGSASCFLLKGVSQLFQEFTGSFFFSLFNFQGPISLCGPACYHSILARFSAFRSLPETSQTRFAPGLSASSLRFRFFRFPRALDYHITSAFVCQVLFSIFSKSFLTHFFSPASIQPRLLCDIITLLPYRILSFG